MREISWLMRGSGCARFRRFWSRSGFSWLLGSPSGRACSRRCYRCVPADDFGVASRFVISCGAGRWEIDVAFLNIAEGSR